jgi:hypothetical protein
MKTTMARRMLTVLTVAVPLLAAGTASSAEFIAGGATAEFVAPPLEAIDDAAATVEARPMTAPKLDLQPLRGQIGGVPTETDEPAGAAGRMLRLYYDVAPDAPFRPYVGAGVGFANARPNELNCMSQCSSLGDADRAIGYQFMAGVTYELKKDVTFFAEHRLSGLARSSLLDNDNAGSRLEIDGPRDRAFGGGIRIGF